MFKRFTSILALGCLLAAGAARADGTRFWKIDSRKDFLSGKFEGISLLADESLRLAPAIDLFADPSVPFIWSMAADGHGGVYIGTGHEGLVLRLDADGDTTVVYDALEPEAIALAVGPGGDLYVGASPEGRIYRVPGGRGTAEVYFDPEEKYIWKLLFGPDGALYAGVGFKGKVYRITGPHEGETVLESEEQHIISLAFDRDKNLLAGSSGSALLYQVTPAGRVSIVYDSPLNDLRSIVVDSKNNLYVSAFEITGGGDQGQRMFSQPDDTGQQSADEQQQQQQQQEGQELKQGMILRPPSARVTPPTNSEIYFLDGDRFVTRIWQEAGDAIMAMGLSSNDKALFVANKDKRSLYEINDRGEVTLINRFGAGDPTGYLELEDRILISTGNPGRLHVLEPGFGGEGTFTSDVQKAGIPARWGRLTWLGDRPDGTNVTFQTRAGNTDQPDTTWSPWSAPLDGSGKREIESPVRRNFQWRVRMTTDNPGRSPRLTEVTVSYLRRNRPPLISPIRFMPQGLYVQPSGPQMSDSEKERLPQEVAQMMDGAAGGSTDNPFQGKKEYDRRLRMAGWNANDANGDKLGFSVYYRGIDQEAWRLLERDTDGNSVIFDTEKIADGRYLLKVVAYDSLDNAAERALTAERISSPFYVDNTAPTIEDLEVNSLNDGRLEVSFRVVDNTTRIERVELTVDSGESRLLAPVDSLLDSTTESFRVRLDKPDTGEHTVSVQAWDRFFNPTAARKSFTID